LSATGEAVGSAAKEKAIGSPGAHASSLLGLANAKLDQAQARGGLRPSPLRDDKK
jgi:type IV secretion system protein TrbL